MHKKNPFLLRTILIEIALFFAYLLLLTWLLYGYAEFRLYGSELRVGALVVALSPAIVVYLLFRLLVGSLAASVVGVAIAAMLSRPI